MDLKQITEQNPWWESPARINEDERVKESTSRIHKIDRNFLDENTLIVGPRQVGKTTFLKLRIKQLIENGVDSKRMLYFSCEVIKDYNDLIEIVRFSDSLIAGKKYIFFDEITFVKEWQRAVKFVLDSPISRDKVIYITGSSSIELKKETFPGRSIKTINFLPLSFKDFCMVFAGSDLKSAISKLDLSENSTGVAPPGLMYQELVSNKAKKLLSYFNEIDILFESYVLCGGFPRSMYELMEQGIIREETSDIYQNWLISDISKAERSLRIASSTLLGVLKNYGTRFSLNSIAKEMEIGSHVTVREYLEILEHLFVLRNIFAVNPQKGVPEFRRMRKVYFTDPFLFHVFKRELAKTKIKEEEVPHLIEGIVGEHLIRKFGEVCYYRQKKEVDFYVNSTGIELKWKSRVKPSDFSASEIKSRILLSKTDFVESSDLPIIPVSIFLLT